MCGIAGVATLGDGSAPATMARLANTMATTLSHRGPDDAGVWANQGGEVALAHRRLSVIDLSPLGHNPMLWRQGDLCITFNGEIYNFAELRCELESAGYRFRSRSDHDVGRYR